MTSRAKPYHVVCPWLVTWKVPGIRDTARRTSIWARSPAKVGQPRWSSTIRNGPGLEAAKRSTVFSMLWPWGLQTHDVRTTAAPGSSPRTSRSPAHLEDPYTDRGLGGSHSEYGRDDVPSKT